MVPLLMICGLAINRTERLGSGTEGNMFFSPLCILLGSRVPSLPRGSALEQLARVSVEPGVCVQSSKSSLTSVTSLAMPVFSRLV